MTQYIVSNRETTDAEGVVAPVNDDAPLAERHEHKPEALGPELVHLDSLTSESVAGVVLKPFDNETVPRAVRAVYGEDSSSKPEVVPAVTAGGRPMSGIPAA